MRELEIKNNFKKDYQRALKQGVRAALIDNVIQSLLNDDILNANLKAHFLKGEFKGFEECHILSDLVIIYKRDKKVLTLYRLGRHQDLFKNY